MRAFEGLPAPRALVQPDAAALAADAADRLLARLAEVQATGRMPHVGLTGGSIADAVHREVARRAPKADVDWSRVVVWWGDERFVPADSPERNARQARAALLDALPLDPARVHEMPAADRVESAEAAAEAYSETMRAHGSRHFDVLMLGLGPDGHIASLFPGHPALEVADRIAVAVHRSPKPPPDRVSLTFAALNHATAVWFVVSGDDKADAVASALAVPGTPAADELSACPGRGVRGDEETLWLLDAAAASRL